MMLHRLGIVAAVAAAAPCLAQDITVRFTNNQPAGGFATSPLWFSFHDGSFDLFNMDGPASAALEALAELGATDGLDAALGGAGVSGVIITQPAAPQFIPGETATATIGVGNRTTRRWFSFASMVVPSNDLFIGNHNPMGYEVFDAAGNFLGPITIQVFGMNVWDAGTEVNDVNNGIAFIVGSDAMAGAAEGGTVMPLFSDAAHATYLASIVGMQTPEYTLTDVLTGAELLATIEIIPAPGSAALLAMLGLAAVRRRR